MFSWWKLGKKQSAQNHRSAACSGSEDREADPVLEVSVQTDVGCHRDVNEDCGRFVRPGASHTLQQKGLLALIADGMGGHAAGEIASGIAVDTISRVYYEGKGNPHSDLEAAFAAANQAIYAASQQEKQLGGMGTTCTALVIRGREAFSTHVGDSRLYLLRDGLLRPMSEDHSLVMEMVRQGMIDMEEARRHESRNVITRALGLQPRIEVATWNGPVPLLDGDTFVLCSDGLYDLVEDLEIASIVADQDLDTAGKRLIALAKERGGYDNITVGLIRLAPSLPLDARPERSTREVEVFP